MQFVVNNATGKQALNNDDVAPFFQNSAIRNILFIWFGFFFLFSAML